MIPINKRGRAGVTLTMAVALFPLLVLPDLSTAGAWPLAPGSGKAVLGISYLTAQSVSDAAGREQEYEVREWGISTYGETGLLSFLSAGWSWGFVKGVHSDALDKLATTDPELSLSLHLGKARGFRFAVHTSVQAPLGPEQPGSVPDYVYPLFSQGAWIWEARPLIGWSGAGYWIQGGAGVRLRTGGLSPQFHYNLAGGRTWARRWSIMLAFPGIAPLDDASTGKPGDQEQYYGVKVAAEYRFSGVWQAGMQFDAMLDSGQEMPLGLRPNLYLRTAW